MKRTKQRDPFFDNAKFLLMFLVVFGHFLQPFTQTNPFYHTLYYFIFLFHMPAFILIAGYFSKSFAHSGSMKTSIKKLILPYIAFQLLYSGYYYWIGLNDKMEWDLLVPQWSLWFLLSLFCWQGSLYLFKRLPASVGIVLSIAISLLAGYITVGERIFALQRTLTFLPYFISGFYLQERQITAFRQSTVKYISIGLLPILYLIVQGMDKMNKYWVFGSEPYEDFLQVPELGAAVRFVVFTFGILGIIGFFGLVPQKKMFFTKWGKNTMLVYLLQGFFVKGLRALSIDELNLTILGFLMIAISSLFLTIVLASDPVQKIKKYLFKKLRNSAGRISYLKSSLF